MQLLWKVIRRLQTKIPTDNEIEALARLSEIVDARIVEIKESGHYLLNLELPENKVYMVICVDTIDEYKTLARHFFKKFMSFSGQIKFDIIEGDGNDVCDDRKST